MLLAGNTSDAYYAKEMLLSGKVTRVVYDVYDAAQYRGILNDSKIEFEAIKQIDASYGVLLAGEARVLKSCVEQYFKENMMQMLTEISSLSVPFKVSFNDLSLLITCRLKLLHSL